MIKRWLCMVGLLLLSASLAGAQDILTGLVGFWKCNEASGNAADSSGGGNTATALNGATFAAGKFGNGCFCDGTNDYWTAANEATFDREFNQPFTIAAWMKPNVADTTRQIVLAKSADSVPYRGIHLATNMGTAFSNDPGKFVLMLWNQNNNTTISVHTTNDTLLNDGSWHHYVWTYSGSGVGSGMTFYQDGTSVPLTIFEDGLQSFTTLNDIPFSFCARGDGAPTNAEFYNGTLDMIKFYTRALTSGDVTELFAETDSVVVTTKKRSVVY